MLNSTFLIQKMRYVIIIPNSKVHGVNMGPIWGWQDPVGSHVGPMNVAIWDMFHFFHLNWYLWYTEQEYTWLIGCIFHQQYDTWYCFVCKLWIVVWPWQMPVWTNWPPCSKWHFHWNENVVILMKFCGCTGSYKFLVKPVNKIVIRMVTFIFQCWNSYFE